MAIKENTAPKIMDVKPSHLRPKESRSRVTVNAAGNSVSAATENEVKTSE